MAEPKVDLKKYMDEIKKARGDLADLISSKNCAPLMFRLAWHDAETYDAKTGTGGPNGSIRFELGEKDELLDAITLCDEIKTKYPLISFADIYQLAGVVAVEITGGPTIEFVLGRRDSMTITPSPQGPSEGSPHSASSDLRQIFRRMGLSGSKDIVALCGSQSLGWAHSSRLILFSGRWTQKPPKFDNSYFMKILKAELEGNLEHPTDKTLVEDISFRRYVQIYARNEEAFFRDYAEAHQKLSELGLIRREVEAHRFML